MCEAVIYHTSRAGMDLALLCYKYPPLHSSICFLLKSSKQHHARWWNNWIILFGLMQALNTTKHNTNILARVCKIISVSIKLCIIHFFCYGETSHLGDLSTSWKFANNITGTTAIYTSTLGNCQLVPPPFTWYLEIFWAWFDLGTLKSRFSIKTFLYFSF